ncbi:MAG: hypothetical protein ACI9KE_001576 [Polyangiales bacterium]|jgi:hypothetical protein
MPRSLLSVLFLATAMACDGEGRVVPFGQETPDEEPNAEASEDEGEPSAITRALGGETTVELEGASFSAENARLHALYADDVDRDGDRDALVLGTRTVESATELLLIFGRREGSHIVTRVLATQRLPNCEANRVEGAFREGDALERVASASVQCGEETIEVRFVVKVESTPRVRERLAVRDGQIALSFPDIDEDEHLDLRAEITLYGRSTTLEWLDRAGGLTRVEGEPEATLSAIRGNENAHELARALCGPDASVAVGGRWGLDCPETSTRGIRLDAALARAGDDLPRALHELTSFSPEDRVEFFERLELPTVGWRRVDHVLPRTPATRHAGLSFADGRTLIDHSTNMSIPLTDSAPTPHMGPAPIRAPGGEIAAVRSVSNRGSIYEINIGSEAPFHSRTQRVFSLPTPPASEWLVLGWAPQGLLLFDGVDRFLATVTEVADVGQVTTQAGNGAGGRRVDLLALRTIETDDLLPAPFHGARTNASGDIWVAETPYGILFGDGSDLTLWRPEGWDDELETLALALGPSGHRVAVAREDGIFLVGTGIGHAGSTATGWGDHM